ncbi:MAG TPA: hypothetical protein VNN73_20425 [Blastocatellia bacterium]|nr:hypothetical protein [Blastocatellia bacterium]
MKQLLLITSLFALAPLAYGQTTNTDAPQQECKLTVAQAPAIRGLRLGMTVEQVVELFTGNSQDEELSNQIKGNSDKFGVAHLTVTPSSYPSKAKFAGVNLVRIIFLDGRVNSFSINYKGPEWDNVDQFITKLSEVYNLPVAKAWRPVSESQRKSLKCDGFEIRAVGYSGETSIQITNAQLGKTAYERREEAKEKARREFKP